MSIERMEKIIAGLRYFQFCVLLFAFFVFTGVIILKLCGQWP